MTRVDAPLPLAAGKRVSDLTTLAKNPLLATLGVRELSTLIDLLDQVAVVSGTTLTREDEVGEYVYFVLEGEAHAKRGVVNLRPLRAGDHFGELSLLGVRARPASVVAVTTLRLARLSRARFVSLASLHPSIAIHFLQALATTLGAELASMTDNVGMLLHERSAPRRTEVRVEREGGTAIVAMGSAIGAALSLDASREPMVVAALLNAKPVSLDTPLTADATIGAITLAAWEGREIYRRSAALLLLEAAHRVASSTDLRLGPSIGSAQVVLVDSDEKDELSRRLTRAMQTIENENAPFREEIWTVEEAKSLFVERGWTAAASLLRTWRDATVTLVTCGDVYAIRSGPLAPSTSFIAGATIKPHPDGLLLDFGDRLRKFLPASQSPIADPSITETSLPRFGGEMEREHRRWLSALGIASVGTFNGSCVTGQVSQLVRISEGFHEKNIGRIADTIAQRRSGKDAIRIIGIAGPSSSGKTTFIKRLTVQLEVNGLRPVNMSLDDYYVERSRMVPDANGELDLEAFSAIDSERVRDHVTRLLAGESVHTAHYDFRAGHASPEGGPLLRLGDGDVLLVEGIHGLNPSLFGPALPESMLFRIFVHAGTSLPFDRLSQVAPEDVRLLRRIVRDRHERGYGAAENILRWPSVRRGEELYIYPYLAQADVVFDTSLVYEIAVLKVFAERYLLEVPEGHAAFTTAYRLRHLIDRFVTIYPDHVPPTSILREFIGGSGFEY